MFNLFSQSLKLNEKFKDLKFEEAKKIFDEISDIN